MDDRDRFIAWLEEQSAGWGKHIGRDAARYSHAFRLAAWAITAKDGLEECHMVAMYSVAPDSPIWNHYEPEGKGDIPEEINKIRFKAEVILAQFPEEE